MSTPSSVLSAPTAVREGAFGHAVHLVCRECRATQPLGPSYACQECFGPLEIGYEFPRFTWAVGAQNLFDTFPDRNLEPNSNLGIFTYPSHSPFGMNGRFVYSRVSYTF